jgi:hypothetical protein
MGRWPKRHPYVLEECPTLHVRDVLGDLDGFSRSILRTWNPPGHPLLTLVSAWGGPFLRWFLLCPRCQRRCEALFSPPGIVREDWRCRLCWNLIYSSQRFGCRHPLRRRLLRKRMTWTERLARLKAKARAPQAREVRTRAGRPLEAYYQRLALGSGLPLGADARRTQGRIEREDMH